MLKVIEDKDLFKLLPLYVDMVKQIEIYKDCSNVEALLDLTVQLTKPDFFAVGDFEGDKLVGFICGFQENKDTWFQSGLYHTIPFRVRKTVEVVEGILKAKGYKAWSTEYGKKDNRCLAPKLGAEVYIIKYKKEI